MKPRCALISLLLVFGFAECPRLTSGNGVTVSVAAANRPAAPALSWTKFADPYEQAFTLEVPQGWTVKGGLFRLGYSDTRAMIDLTSPDDKASIRIGDVAIPPYFVPDQYHPKEGEPYDLGAQAQMTVAKYRQGQEFARLYALQRFLRICQKLEPQSITSSAPMQDYVPPGAAAPSQSSPGQMSYLCTTNASSSGSSGRIAYVYAKTGLFGALWEVTSLASFIVPPDQLADVRAILLHATQTFQLTPQWIEHQKQQDAEGLQYQRLRQQKRLNDLGQQVQQFETKMRAMQSQVSAFERQQNAQARQVESMGNTLTGIQPTTDPLGNERDVWMGPNANYWTNGTGTVVNSTNPPGAGWQQLKPHE